MIVVTGATGQLGSQIVQHLLERMPARDIGVSVRDPARAADLADRGVRVRRGDFADPDTLAAAFDGASQVLVVSVNKLGDQGVAESTAAADAAYRAGAGRVLYTSHQAARPDSLFPPARDHAAVEAHLEATGRPWTSLRNGYYTASLQFHLGLTLRAGQIEAPADGPVSWTARSDLAEAAAAVLADEGRFEGPTPPLPAAEAVDLHQIAAVLSETSGGTVRRTVTTDEDWVAGLAARGTPEVLAQQFLRSYEAARRGEFAVTDPTFAALLGREPRSIRSELRDERAR